MSEKLQKVLARAGLGSRREIESQIQAARVSVNGVVAKLGDRLEDLNANVRIDGHSVQLTGASELVCRVLAYNKPEGELCTRSDPDGRRTVFDRLPRIKGSRWIAVGRLDANTSGLLLFTTDGELANRLMHPSRQIQREYLVRVFGEVNDKMVKNLVHGVQLEDGQARFEDVLDAGGEGSNRTFYVVLSEGRNREVRRLWETQGVTVSRLKRVRYGDIRLGKELPRGGWMELELDEVNYLRDMVELRPEKETFISPESRKRTPRGQKIRRAVRRHDDRADSPDTRTKPRSNTVRRSVLQTNENQSQRVGVRPVRLAREENTNARPARGDRQQRTDTRPGRSDREQTTTDTRPARTDRQQRTDTRPARSDRDERGGSRPTRSDREPRAGGRSGRSDKEERAGGRSSSRDQRGSARPSKPAQAKRVGSGRAAKPTSQRQNVQR